MIVAIAVLIAGFLARRMMMPGAAHYLAHQSRESDSTDTSTARSNDNGSGEHLSDSDRRALDEVIRRKTGGQ